MGLLRRYASTCTGKKRKEKKRKEEKKRKKKKRKKEKKKKRKKREHFAYRFPAVSRFTVVFSS